MTRVVQSLRGTLIDTHTVASAAPGGPLPGDIWLDPTASAPPGGLLFGPTGEIILGNYTAGTASGGGVGRYTRTAGPQQDAHLRAGVTPGSFALLEAPGNALVASNATWDGTNWNRVDTSLPAVVLNAQGATGQYFLHYAPAGANPITFQSMAIMEAVSGAAQERSDYTARIIAARNLELTGNLYLDSAGNWNLLNTGLNGVLVLISDGGVSLYTATAGANPRTLTLVGNFTVAAWARSANPPRGKAYGGTSGVIADSNWRTLVLAATAYDTGGAAGGTVMSLNPARFTAPVAGIYDFRYQGYYPSGAVTIVGACLRFNGGASYLGQDFGFGAVGGNTYVVATAVTEMQAGQFMEPCLYLTASGSPTVTITHLYFSGQYLSLI